jgi:putative N6-adenine-specific DNA methylase
MSRMDIPLKVDKNSALRILIRLFEDRCTLSMDTTGEALYKRGYRRDIGEAPLRETTAAALLMACDFIKFPIIADPLCGSGTCVIEAAQMLCSLDPGMHRSFAFEAWPSFTAAAWNYLRKKSLAGVKTHCEKILVAQDKDQKALNALKENAKRAGVDAYITIQKQTCLSFNSDGHLGNCGLIISNLPYGKRSGESDLVKNLYLDFGRHLKKSCKGWHFGFVIPAEGIYYRKLGLKSSSVIHFSNGGLPVQFIMGVI